MPKYLPLLFLIAISALPNCTTSHSSTLSKPSDLFHQSEFGYVNNDGINIHYASIGKGPLIILLHGTPEHWYAWRHQMLALKEDFQLVAIDLRGFNKSDKPKEVTQYKLSTLTKDVISTIQYFNEKNGVEKNQSATIVGQDWGGEIAWTMAQDHPQWVKNLIIFNTAHPRNMARERVHNERQRKGTEASLAMKKEDAYQYFSVEGVLALMTHLEDDETRTIFKEALSRTNFRATTNYYKANFPDPPFKEDHTKVVKIDIPVLVFQGLDDPGVMPSTLNELWHIVNKDLTIITLPDVGHFSHSEAHEMVTPTMNHWLQQRTKPAL